MKLAILFLLTASLAHSETVTVYAYDSFSGKGTVGALVADELAKSGVQTKFVTFGSAGEALNQIALEGKATKADLVVGIDDSLLIRARRTEAFEALEPSLLNRIPEDLRFDRQNQVVPFDYGYLTLVYDSRRTPVPAEGLSLREFARRKNYAKKVVIEDPRTSSIGLSFLLWTHGLFSGEEAIRFWEDFSKQVVTVSPGWSGAYGLFLKKEADFVVSYTTSPAYHLEKEKLNAFRGLSFSDGHYRQVEGLALVRHSKAKASARRWLETLLSDAIQSRIPTTQWMYPVVKGIKLPASFEALPAVSKRVKLEPETIEKSERDWIRQWTKTMADGGK